MAAKLDVASTLDVARRLQPNVKKVYVISDDSVTGKGERRDVAKAAKGYPSLEFHFLNGEDYSEVELLDKLRGLGDDSIVLLTIWLRDNTGRYIPNDIAARQITTASPVPVYALTNIWLGHGIIGGKLNTGREQGHLAAEIVVKIVRDGVKPWEIPISRAAPAEYLFDYKVMHRFGISRDLLPPGSTVINQPFSFYQTYKTLVWAVASVIVVLSMLVTGLGVNIVRRHRAEAVLRESEARFKKIFQTSPDSMAITRMSDNKIMDVNDAFVELTGRSRDELLGHTTLELGIWKDASLREDWVARLRKEGSVPAIDFSVVRPNGEIRHTLTSATVIRLGGEPHILALARDMTDQQRAEQQRREMERRIEHAQKLESLGILAGGIAHDFNNLLVGILGNAELALRDLPPTWPAGKSVEEIRQAAIRASELTNQMLAYSGKGRMLVEPVDLNELVREMGQLLRVTIGSKTTLQYDLDPDLPAIEADASQIRQVVMNLITNAADAVGHAEGVIRVATALVNAQPEDLAGIVHQRRTAGRALRPTGSRRHRLRHGRRNARPTVRAVLHHQVRRSRPRHVGRAGNRPKS